MNEEQDHSVACYGGCGQRADDPEQQGWELLPITNKYRCGACTRALKLVSTEKQE